MGELAALNIADLTEVLVRVSKRDKENGGLHAERFW
jgi:hypothetical protein